MTAIHLSPEEISAHRHISRGEKLEWLSDMKSDLELRNLLGTVDPERFDRQMASIENAIARVTRDAPDRRRRRYGRARTLPGHISHI